MTPTLIPAPANGRFWVVETRVYGRTVYSVRDAQRTICRCDSMDDALHIAAVLDSHPTIARLVTAARELTTVEPGDARQLGAVDSGPRFPAAVAAWEELSAALAAFPGVRS